MENDAKRLYEARLPYHNFRHALKVIEAGRILLERCHAEGLAIDGDVVYYALLFHDAGYGADPIEKGFSSKEAYSVQLAEERLKHYGVSQETITRVGEAIMATLRHGNFDSLEAKVVRAADLSGLMAEYAEFLADAKHLHQEAELLGGKKIPWSDWKLSVKETIEFYLGQSIKLTKFYFDKDGNSEFHTKVRKNLERFLRE